MTNTKASATLVTVHILTNLYIIFIFHNLLTYWFCNPYYTVSTWIVRNKLEPWTLNFSKPKQSSSWLVGNRNKGPTMFCYLDLPDRAISSEKWNNCGNQKENLYLPFLHGCSSVSSWLWENNRLTYTHSNLLFQWVPVTCTTYCFQLWGHCYVTISIVFPPNHKLITYLVGMGADRPPINNTRSQVTFRREITFNLAGASRGGGFVVVVQ